MPGLHFLQAMQLPTRTPPRFLGVFTMAVHQALLIQATSSWGIQAQAQGFVAACSDSESNHNFFKHQCGNTVTRPSRRLMDAIVRVV